MPKSEKNTRPYNRNQKKLAKGEAARKKAVEEGKATGGRLSAGRKAQVNRNLLKKLSENSNRRIKAWVKEKGSLAPADRAGGSLAEGTTYKRGKDGKVSKSQGGRVQPMETRKANTKYANYDNVRPRKVSD